MWVQSLMAAPVSPCASQPQTQPAPEPGRDNGRSTHRGRFRHSRPQALLAVLLCSLLPVAVRGHALTSMAIMKLDSIDPLAVCNDGSPGALYFHKAPQGSTQSNLWLFYLEGGDWCYDAASCATRFKVSPQFMTTNNWPGIVSLGGIFSSSPRKSPWAGANKIYVGYCSSDAWVGDVEASPDTFNMAFRGQRIVAAALALTVSKFGMGSTAGQRLLFAGCSAGSRGAMFTIDYLPAMLHDLGVPTANLQVQGMFDSPMWVDVEPITGEDGPIVPLQEQTQAILELVNATGRLGPTCQVAFPPAEWWKCLYGQYRLPFVETPYAMNAAQFDKFQLPYNEGGNPPYNAAGLAYASNFQDAVRSALAPLPTSEQPGSAVYSAACFHHCVTQEPSYWAIHVYNVSFRDLTAAWYFQNDAPLKYVEQCDGFKCGTCRSHRKHPGAPPDPRPKPPRAPAPPDPFAIWSPPPPVTLAAGSILPRVRSTSTVSATAAKHRADVMRWVVLFAVLLGVLTGYTFISRRTRRLRAIPTPGWSEGTEGMPLIPNRGGVGRGGGAASAAVSSFRSDTRYAKPPGSGGAALSVPDEMVRGPLPAPTAPAGRPLGRSPSAGRYTGRR